MSATKVFVANHDFVPQHDSQLSLSQDSSYTVLKTNTSRPGWWLVQATTGETGFVPGSYLAGVAISGPAAAPTHANADEPPASDTDDEGPKLFVASKGIKATVEDHLSLQQGDEVILLKRETKKPGWCQVLGKNDEIGLVPKRILQLAGPEAVERLHQELEQESDEEAEQEQQLQSAQQQRQPSVASAVEPLIQSPQQQRATGEQKDQQPEPSEQKQLHQPAQQQPEPPAQKQQPEPPAQKQQLDQSVQQSEQQPEPSAQKQQLDQPVPQVQEQAVQPVERQHGQRQQQPGDTESASGTKPSVSGGEEPSCCWRMLKRLSKLWSTPKQD